ncbi:MAG: TIM barrel protein [Terriglobia bacterium]
MKLGIGTYAYMWSIGFPGAAPKHPLDALGLLEKAQHLGVRVVQYGPNLSLGVLSRRDLEAVKQRSRAWGIEIEIGTRGLVRDHLLGQMELAREVGSTLLRSIPEMENGRTATMPEIRDHLGAIVQDLEKAEIRLALENGRIPAQELSEVLDSLQSPWLGITLDTVNSLAIPEGTEQVVRVLARHTMCFHVKDFVIERAWHLMGFTVEGRAAGKGQMNFPWILQQLRAAGSTANAILELWPPPQAELEATIAVEQAWAEESIHYLRQYIPD